MRRKEDGRVREQKWFTDDLQKRGAIKGSQARNEDERADAATLVPTAAAIQPTGPKRAGANARGRGRSRASFAERVSSASHVRAGAAPAQSSEALPEPEPAEHEPTAVEASANQMSLKVIREIYGSRAHTLINILLAFDAYFSWFYPFKKSIPYLCGMEIREARALDNCRRAIDMQEMFERVSIYNHHSFLPHGAVFKVTRDILQVGDVSVHDLSALELQNAETKRVFESGGSRHLKMSAIGTTHKKDSEGGYKKIVTKGYGSTAASTVLFKLLATQKLRQGDEGIAIAIPTSRRGERLFGVNAIGRSSLVKLEIHGEAEKEYDPANDTCIDAFVRLLEARITSNM